MRFDTILVEYNIFVFDSGMASRLLHLWHPCEKQITMYVISLKLVNKISIPFYLFCLYLIQALNTLSLFSSFT